METKRGKTTIEIIKSLEKQRRLSPIERIIATTTGSVTQILEAYLGEEVGIHTIEQRVKEAGEMAEVLGIRKGDKVNYRVVEIRGRGGRVLIKAVSWTPLKRLKNRFKDDLMRADIPIGKILLKHQIESRRELRDVKVEGGRIKRTYDIISDGGVLMRIEEVIYGDDF